MPSLPDFSIKQLDALTPLPDDFSTVKDGRYVIKTSDSIDQEADGSDVKTKIWFQTKVSSSSCNSSWTPYLMT